MKIRINNIECKKNSVGEMFEILRWYPNSLYNQKLSYMKDGYIEEDGFLRNKEKHVSIQSSIFDKKETCCVIAFLNYNHKEPDVDLKSVGSRLLDLTQEERNDFFQVYEIANKYIMNYYND